MILFSWSQVFQPDILQVELRSISSLSLLVMVLRSIDVSNHVLVSDVNPFVAAALRCMHLLIKMVLLLLRQETEMIRHKKLYWFMTYHMDDQTINRQFSVCQLLNVTSRQNLTINCKNLLVIYYITRESFIAKLLDTFWS